MSQTFVFKNRVLGEESVSDNGTAVTAVLCEEDGLAILLREKDEQFRSHDRIKGLYGRRVTITVTLED
jgi:hypothetical protein